MVATGADGSVRERSEHVLEAEDLLRWSYVAFGDGDEVHQSCDGVELVQAAHGRSTRTRVAGGPEFFSSWPGVVDAWLVEMLRPVDLLARVAVSSITGDRLVRMTATPLGNEPSPYNGFSIPDGRTLAMSLDMERGCFTGAAVTRPGCDALTFTVTHVE
ncbi:hypothetical protein [Streptoalloteichus tenebrarius]|uniref:hypothetical protein n=1 Tax=Streptoalloteichus tenebrarius (strain ATCC 17920 / DSM 40477 / JCM 4838 / CBS 697.72 / NBRC 16177 / NCIMB 11028 / NRRL B-12390 / A12253. 1 / ISP 5477) TaxID=1933 RepID=UPI0020A36BFC|nr:hypothetical protein [Streptoalloteichus tenebrarius]